VPTRERPVFASELALGVMDQEFNKSARTPETIAAPLRRLRTAQRTHRTHSIATDDAAWRSWTNAISRCPSLRVYFAAEPFVRLDLAPIGISGDGE
jgi:hypothetical protein